MPHSEPFDLEEARRARSRRKRREIRRIKRSPNDEAHPNETEAQDLPEGVALDDFVSYLPMHNYIFIPTREMWPAGASTRASRRFSCLKGMAIRCLPMMASKRRYKPPHGSTRTIPSSK